MFVKKNAIISAVLFLGMAGFYSGYSQALRQEGKYWIGEIQKTFKVEKNGSLIMEDIQGQVNIKAWDKNEVSIHEVKKMDIFTKSEAEAAMKNSESGYVQQGNVIRVGGPAFDRSWIQSTFTIFIPAEMECSIHTKGGSVSVEGTKGNVTTKSGGGEITLRNVGGIVQATTGGGQVLVEESRGPVTVSTGGGQVEIMRTLNKVKVNTGGGEVEIQETQGSVEVKTGGGNVDVSKASGDVTVMTGGGDVTIRDVTGNLIAKTGGGTVRATNLKGTVSAKTGGGDIDLLGMQGAVDVSTGGGDIIAEITLTDFSIKHAVDVQTGGGNIRLTLPDKIPATVYAKIEMRQKRWEDYTVTSDFPLQIRTNDDEPGMRIIEATGTINGGGDPITLRTGGGNIRILKMKK